MNITIWEFLFILLDQFIDCSSKPLSFVTSFIIKSYFSNLQMIKVKNKFNDSLKCKLLFHEYVIEESQMVSLDQWKFFPKGEEINCVISSIKNCCNHLIAINVTITQQYSNQTNKRTYFIETTWLFSRIIQQSENAFLVLFEKLHFHLIFSEKSWSLIVQKPNTNVPRITQPDLGYIPWISKWCPFLNVPRNDNRKTWNLRLCWTGAKNLSI